MRSTAPLLVRLAGPAALASAVLGAVAVVLLIGMYAGFGLGARQLALVVGTGNDVLTMVAYALLLPVIVAAWSRLSPLAPAWFGPATVVGLVAATAVVVLQWLLVTGTLTFEQQIGPVTVAFLALGAWFVGSATVARASGAEAPGLGLSILATFYVGYPLWILRLRRAVLLPDRAAVPEVASTAGA